jgi:D-lactate dehydrogenase
MPNKILVFDAKPYDIDWFRQLNKAATGLEFDFIEVKLNAQTASLAAGYKAVCVFVHDQVDEKALEKLAKEGVSLIALRCAGYNNVAIKKAHQLGLKVVRVPEYSPFAVAEHAVALIMALNRNTHRAYARVRENNFSLNGLIGFDMHGKTVGVIGTGKIGQVFIRIMHGFGCQVVAYDLYPNTSLEKELGLKYLPLNELLAKSDIISLHLPLSKETNHLIDQAAINKMKDGVILVNTSRGQLVDSKALIEGLKDRKIKAAGLDVYEEEDQYFFEDHSNKVVLDDTLARLLSFNNVLITSHQAFFTEEALKNITVTTIENIAEFFDKEPLKNEVKV